MCALGFAGIVDGHDVRMVQGGGGARLLLEAPEAVRIAGDLGGEQLEGHGAAHAGIARAIHFAHPARTHFLEQFVVKNVPGRHDRAILLPAQRRVKNRAGQERVGQQGRENLTTGPPPRRSPPG
jgi:hypothetical protein